jgi:hypothetical protein
MHIKFKHPIYKQLLQWYAADGVSYFEICLKLQVDSAVAANVCLAILVVLMHPSNPP